MTPAMKRTLASVFLLLAAAAAAIYYVTLPAPIAVTVAQVATGAVEKTVTNTRAGSVKACHRARLTPPTGGQVERLLVAEGDPVVKGQLLLELWNRDLSAQLSLAHSEAVAADAKAEEACALADAAQRDQRRIERLYAQQLVAEEQRDSARSQARSRNGACAAAQASAAVSRDQIEVAEAALARTRLTAPFAGTVAEVTGEPGEVVTPSPPGIPTPPAIDLVDTTCLYVTAPIDEYDAPEIAVGMPVRITLDAFADRSFSGTVRRIAPYVLDVEKQARTLEVEVAFADPQVIAGLLPGYSADVEIILERRDGVLRIPAEALIEGDRVLLIDPEQRLVERTIEVGIANWRYAEVRSGLNAGEQVVTSVGREGVKAGAAVRIEAAP